MPHNTRSIPKIITQILLDSAGVSGMPSSLSLLRLPLFNKKFFRLLPGKNVLSVTGSITNLKITYSFAKKIGG